MSSYCIFSLNVSFSAPFQSVCFCSFPWVCICVCECVYVHACLCFRVTLPTTAACMWCLHQLSWAPLRLPAVYTGVWLLRPVWSVSSQPRRPLWHAWPPPVHAFCLSSLPKTGPDRWFGILIIGVPMESNLLKEFMALYIVGTGRRVCMVLKTLLVTQPHLPFSVSPLAPFYAFLISKFLLLHFVAFGHFSPLCSSPSFLLPPSSASSSSFF